MEDVKKYLRNENSWNTALSKYKLTVHPPIKNINSLNITVSDKKEGLPLFTLKLYYYYPHDEEFDNKKNRNNIDIYINEIILQDASIKNVVSIYMRHKEYSSLLPPLPKPLREAIAAYYGKKDPAGLEDMNVNSRYKLLLFEYSTITLEDFINNYKVDDTMMTYLVFQIIYTLYVLGDNLYFSYDDLELRDIVIDADLNYQYNKKNYYQYTIGNRSYYLPISKFVAKLRNFDKVSVCIFNQCLIVKNEGRVPSICSGSIRDVWTLFGKLIATTKTFSIYEEFVKTFNTAFAASKKLGIPLQCSWDGPGSLKDYRKVLNGNTLKKYSNSCSYLITYQDLFHSVFGDLEQWKSDYQERIMVKPITNLKCDAAALVYFNKVRELINRFLSLRNAYKDIYEKLRDENANLAKEYGLKSPTFRECTIQPVLTNNDKTNNDKTNNDAISNFFILNAKCVNDVTDQIRRVKYLSVIFKLIDYEYNIRHQKKYNVDVTYEILYNLSVCRQMITTAGITTCLENDFNDKKINDYNSIDATPFYPQRRPTWRRDLVELLASVLDLMVLSDSYIDYILDLPAISSSAVRSDFFKSLKTVSIISTLNNYRLHPNKVILPQKPNWHRHKQQIPQPPKQRIK